MLNESSAHSIEKHDFIEKYSTSINHIDPTYRGLANWYEMVMNFSRRTLTYEVDKIPAIFCLTARLAKNDLKYCAGLWWDNMPRGMLWKRDGGYLPEPTELLALS